MQELDYNPSKKDLTDARIHHLLAEELKPYKRVSYSKGLSFKNIIFLKQPNEFRWLTIENNVTMLVFCPVFIFLKSSVYTYSVLFINFYPNSKNK